MGDPMEKLVYPGREGISILDVARELRSVLKGEGTGNRSLTLSGKRVAVILLDGLGYELAVRAGLTQAERITTVFPSITVTVLTTLFTGEPPGVHGVHGWRVYDKLVGSVVNYLDEQPKRSLAELVRPVTSYVPEDSLFLSPSKYVNRNLFSGMLVNGKFLQYYTPWDGWLLASEVAEKYRPKFLFLYVPYVDTVSHHYGPDSPATLDAARDVVRMTNRLADELSKHYSVVITSDHGHVKVDGLVDLAKDEELLETLHLPPFGDHRNLMILGKGEAKKILEGYGLRVYDRDEAKALMLGERVPDYVAVPTDNRIYQYWPDEDQREYRGTHGGLSPEEMYIPLVIREPEP